MLHRAIYLAAICGVIHYYWLVKSDVRNPLFYAALVSILLLWRLGDWFAKKGALGARENRNEPRFRQRFLAPLAAHETTQQTLRCRRPTPRHQ